MTAVRIRSAGARIAVPGARKPRVQHELPIQKAIVNYLRAVLPPDHMVVHVPMNARSKVAGATQKSMGAVKGITDLLILRPRDPVALVEVKHDGNDLTGAQPEIRDWCVRHSYPWCIARSIDDVRRFLSAHGIPNREAA